MSQDQPDYAQMRKDEHVRDLFAWIQRREAHGAKVGRIISEFETGAPRPRPEMMKTLKADVGWKIIFADTNLTIWHDENRWQLG